MLPTTLSGYIALARDVLIVAAVLTILYLVYRGGEDHVRGSDLRALQKQITAQAAITSEWKDQANAAQQQLQSDMAAIAAASSAPVVHQWVSDQTCPAGGVLSSTPAETATGSAAAGPVVGGGGNPVEADRRDAIVAGFKARWETVLAGCRAEDAAWPR